MAMIEKKVVYICSYRNDNCHYIIYFSSSISAKFPYLKIENLSDRERDELLSRLTTESEIIKDEFSVIVSKTEQSLEDRNTSVKQLILILKNTFREHSAIDVLKSQTDICDAFIELYDHWSFFDFRILSLFIKAFCSKDPELIESFNDYKLHFKQYCEKRLNEVPADSFDAEDSQKKHTYLHVKLDAVFSVKLNDIKQINRRISHMLETSVRLVKFEEGCIELIYITLCEINEMFHLSGQQIHELMHMGIIKIYAKKDDKCISIGDIKELRSGKYINS